MATPSVRFWAKVNKTAGCWLWTGCITAGGYGQIGVAGKVVSAHRLSYILAHGQVPQGSWVLHHCDVRHCVNPAHLYVGSAADNSRDAVLRDRLARGDRHGSRIHPERLARGDRHGTHTHPEAFRWNGAGLR